ncbi:hypothetical protein D3C81_1840570 [compost metagenome]
MAHDEALVGIAQPGGRVRRLEQVGHAQNRCSLSLWIGQNADVKHVVFDPHYDDPATDLGAGPGL